MPDMISVKIDDQQVVDHLKQLEKKAGDLSQVMRDISEDMLDAVLENFAKEGRPNPWKKSKRGKKDSGKTLQDTARLMKSITARSDSKSAMVGTNVKYAAIHHFGGKIRHPARDRVMHFRQVQRGKMTHGKPGTGDRFAKASKAHYAMKVSGKAYTINMPARPYLLLADSDTLKIVERMKRYLEE